MERQRVLQILYESIEDKTRLHSSKRVVSVVQTDREAVIVSEDGSKLGCDFVAGADGVRSVIRREIEKATLATKGPESRESSLVKLMEPRSS
jgi:FAD dependent monooxygenase